MHVNVGAGSYLEINIPMTVAEHGKPPPPGSAGAAGASEQAVLCQLIQTNARPPGACPLSFSLCFNVPVVISSRYYRVKSFVCREREREGKVFESQVGPYKSVLSLHPIFLLREREQHLRGLCVPCGPVGAAAVSACHSVHLTLRPAAGARALR